MTIKHLDLKQWDEITSIEGEPLPFMTSNFLQNITIYSKSKMDLLGFYQGTQLIGYMPAFYVNIGPFKTFFSPPYNSAVPFLGYSNSKNYENQKQSKKEGMLKTIAVDIVEEINANKVQYTAINLDHQKIDIRPFMWRNFDIKPIYDYVLSLERLEDDIWNGFKKEARKEIIASEKKGLVVKRGTEVDQFWDFEDSRYKEQNLKTPIFSKSYIQSLVSNFSENIHLYYVYDSNDCTVGSVIIFTSGNNAYVWLGNTRSCEGVYANELLIWEIIKRYKSSGFERVIIIGANQERLCRFKLKFNPTPILRFSIIFETVLGKMMSSTYRNFFKRL